MSVAEKPEMTHLPVRFRKLQNRKGKLRPGWFPIAQGPIPSQPNQSLLDAMRVLQAVLFSPVPVTAAEVSRHLEMELTRAHRLLRTLSMMGMTFQTARKRFAAGPGMHVLSAQSLLNSDLSVAAKDPLDALHVSTGQEVALGILWQDYVSYMYHAAPDMPVEAAAGQVSMFEASRSSIGQVLLGDYPEAGVRRIYAGREIAGYEKGGVEQLIEDLGRVRERGYARVEREEATGRVTLAVKVMSRPFAAIAMGGDLPAEQTEALVERLREAARAIDERLERPEQGKSGLLGSL